MNDNEQIVASNRSAFEKAFPVPAGIYWNEISEQYDGLPGSVGLDEIEAYQARFEGWQAARVQGGKELEPIGFYVALKRAKMVFEAYREDYPKHGKVLDGTRAANDMPVRVAQAFCNLYPHPQPAQQGSVPEWAKEISENLKTQDNRMTQDPLFVVFQKREIVVDEDYDHDRIAWGNSDGEADDEVQEKLNELYDDLDSDFFRSDDITLTDEDGTAEWRRVALKEVDEFVTACFTEAGANDYLKLNGHNLIRPYIYVTSLYRNEEMKRLREWLIATTPQPEGDGSIPKGWKLVPIQSTINQRKAAWDAHICSSEDADAVYGAMLAAAPQPPVEQGAG